ncbi:MAG: uracil-DNA glycosylase [Legionellaceae bacterium]|nr:uracil-DNA glycosylase [Legionellaceae bacterium]MBP9774437.1 uracil-DNA glycosylase [Legionellaceae bacterium]
MGITSWLVRDNPQRLSTLQQLATEVAACTRCPLHQTRSQTVFARGNPQAKLMIIGEAPGFHEDQQGLPFVGVAGSLLDQMISCIGLINNEIYIANVLKCRPPNNRDPQSDEITQCSSYLAQQISLVKPTLLLALGRFAGQYLLNTTHSLTQMRAQKHDYQNIPVIVTYHPAYLLRNPLDKKRAYQDWLTVQQLLQS